MGFITAALIVGGAGLIGSGVSAGMSSSAAGGQSKAAREAAIAQMLGYVQAANAAQGGAQQAINYLNPYAQSGQGALNVLQGLLYGSPGSAGQALKLPRPPKPENFGSKAEFLRARQQFRDQWAAVQQQAAAQGSQVPSASSFEKTSTILTVGKGNVERPDTVTTFDDAARNKYINDFNAQQEQRAAASQQLARSGWEPGSLLAQYTPEKFAEQNSLTDNPAGWLAEQLAAPKDFQQSPGYQWQLDQGLRAATNAQAARGMGKSGAAMKELNTYAQGLANQDYGNWWQRQMGLKQLNLGQYNAAFGQNMQGKNFVLNALTGLTNQGQSAAAAQGQYAYGAGNSLANLYANAGQSQANAAMMQGQIAANRDAGIANAINGGIQNAIGAYAMTAGAGKPTTGDLGGVAGYKPMDYSAGSLFGNMKVTG